MLKSVWAAVLCFSLVDLCTQFCMSFNNNCAYCSDSNNCGNCYYGYGIDSSSGSNQCTSCALSNCGQCYSDFNTCTSCQSGYYFTGSSCVGCSDSHCLYCPGGTSNCNSCQSSYRVTASNTCQMCNQFSCNQCPADIYTCTACSSYYGLVGSSCVACYDLHCMQCYNDPNICTYCVSGYGISGTTCVSCAVANCWYCGSNYLACTGCVGGYVAQAGACVNCFNGICNACEYIFPLRCSGCISGYGVFNGTCVACSVPNCNQCNSGPSSCAQCASGFGVSNNGSCEACQSPCTACSGSNSHHCTACVDGQYADSSGSCNPCMTNCLICTTGSTCDSCADGYFINSFSNCQSCPLHCTLCVYNSSASSPSCTACQLPLYGLSHSTPYACDEICGDSLVFTLPCDNQIGIDYDGCDDTCGVMTGFTCNTVTYTINSSQQVSECSYHDPILMDIVSIETEPGKNVFVMKVSIWPPLNVFKTSSNLISVFKMGDSSMTITAVEFDSQTNQLVLKVDLSQIFWDRLITIEFAPDQNVDRRYFASVTSSASLKTQLFYYSDIVLAVTPILPYVCYAIVGVGSAGAVFGILAKRLAGLEVMIAAQITLLSLIWMNSFLLDPFKQSKSLKYVFGYHQELFPSPNASRLLSAAVRNNPSYTPGPFYSQFGVNALALSNNFNILFFIQLAPLPLYLITRFILAYFNRKLIVLKQNMDEQQMPTLNQKINQATTVKQLSLQWLMYIGMFNLIPFVVSSTFFLKFSPNLATDVNSLIIFSAGALVYSFTFFMFYYDAGSFDYFRFSFKLQILAMGFYFLYIPAIVLSAVLLICVPTLWASVIPVGCLTVFTIIYRPYREVKQNIRAIFNFLIIVGFLSLRVFNAYFDPLAPIITNYSLLYYIVCLLALFISALVSLVLMIHITIYRCCIQPKLEANEKDKVMMELEEINVRQKMINIENSDNVFKSILEPRMNIMDFTHNLSLINQPEDDQSPTSLHVPRAADDSFDNIDIKSKNLRKQMEKYKLREKANLDKTYDKKEQIDKLKYELETQQSNMKKEVLQNNLKKVYAMEVMNDEATWLRLKNANDYTKDKMKDFDKNAFDYRMKYDQI